MSWVLAKRLVLGGVGLLAAFPLAFAIISPAVFFPIAIMLLALVFGYALLGAGWLILKTEGDLLAFARRAGRYAFLTVLVAVAAISIWTPLADPAIAHRWFAWPHPLYLAVVPIVTALLALLERRALAGRYGEAIPFVAALALFQMSYLGIAINLWPYIVPCSYTLWQAASSEGTQAPADRHTIPPAGDPALYWLVLLVFRGTVRHDSRRRSRHINKAPSHLAARHNPSRGQCLRTNSARKTSPLIPSKRQSIS